MCFEIDRLESALLKAIILMVLAEDNFDLLQAYWRGFQVYRSYQQLKAALMVQRCWRGSLARRAVAQQHKAAISLQTAWRRHFVQQQYARVLWAVTRIQAS